MRLLHKGKAVKRIIALVVVVAVGGTGFHLYKRHFGNKKNEAQVFKPQQITELVARQDMQEVITASGSVLLKDEIEVYAEGETNKIKDILVEEGDLVEVGELLVEYDVEDTKEELEKNIRDTKVSIKNAELSLESIVTPATESELTKLQNAVTKAQKALDDANTSLANYEVKISQQQTAIDNANIDLADANKTVENNAKLLEVGGITKSEYDQSVVSAKRAEDTYNEALQAMEEIQTTKASDEKNIVTLEGSLKEAINDYTDAQDVFSDTETKIKYEQQLLSLETLKTSLADYEEDLAELVYTTTSPVSGRVTEVCVDSGTYTEENTVMLKVADFNNLIVSANIEEYDAPNVEVGQKVSMTSDGLTGKVYTGTIIKVDPSASSATSMMGTETVVPIEISVDNPDGVLKPNYSLDLEIAVLDRADVLAVPTSAVGEEAKTKEYYVYKVEGDSIKKTTIEVGEYGETVVEIIGGISEGDEVITTISDILTDGMTLEEVRALSATSNKSESRETGGMEDDRNSGFGQMLQSGGSGGNRPSGGMPPSR